MSNNASTDYADYTDFSKTYKKSLGSKDVVEFL